MGEIKFLLINFVNIENEEQIVSRFIILNTVNYQIYLKNGNTQ